MAIEEFYEQFEIKNKLNDLSGLYIIEETTTAFPFKIERLYWLTNKDSSIIRGMHAHKKLNQLLVCISGQVKIQISTHNERSSLTLAKTGDALMLRPGLWREIEIKEAGALLVVCDRKYDEADYIRDRIAFDQWFISNHN